MASVIVNRFFFNLANKAISWTADIFKVALLTATYTPDKDHSVWADISAYEISGTGYTAGGQTATSLTLTQDDSGDLAKLDMGDSVWASSTISAGRAAIVDTTLAADDVVCIFEFTEEKSSSNGTFTLQWNADGVATLQQS